MLGEKTVDELQCLKRELKAWESMFERKHARKPNKDDVNNASEEIRETYVKYNQLKRSSIDTKRTLIKPKEKEDIEDEIFGKSLNKSITPVSAKKSVGLKVTPNEYKPIKLCHGQRKVKSSPKSLPNKLKTDFMESNGGDAKSFCMPTKKDNGMSDDLGFDISTSAKKDFLNKPGMMLGKSALTKRMKRRSALTSDWLEKSQSGLADDHPNESDPVLSPDNFDEYEKRDYTREFIDGNRTVPTTGLNDGKIATSKTDSITNNNRTISQTMTALDGASMQVSEECKNLNSDISSKITSDVGETSGNIESSFGRNHRLFPCSTTTGQSSIVNNSFTSISSSNKNTDSPPIGKTARSSKITDDDDALPSSIENNIDVPSKVQSSKFQTTKNVSNLYSKRKRRPETAEEVLAGEILVGEVLAGEVLAGEELAGEDLAGEEENLDPSTEGDLHGKPSKKRKTSDAMCKEKELENVGNFEENDDTSGQSEDERPEMCYGDQKSGSKRSSGLVSENFRALNLKVRRFNRRGQGTNYAAYKRKMWKQKQQANEKADCKKAQWKKSSGNGGGNKRRISSTTTTTCFKCGEDGHWAKDCPRNKPARAQIPAENWSEPVTAPADLEIADKQWDATEEKLKFLVSDRLPRAQDTPGQAPPAIEPLYQPENGQPVGTPLEVYEALNKLGFDTFRCGQEEAIMQILCGLSSLVVLSTGAGKSLCYQLPAYMYSKRSPCITLVVSPLVSLMEDQVVGLPFGLHGVSLNTNMTKPQRLKAVDQICSGKAAVVLVSPEALVGGSSAVGCLPHPSKLPPIAFACIDEAHCVSEWSHNFRPSYLRVCKVLRERFGVRCFLGLTATATRSTALSVCEHLGIVHRPEAIVRGATIPDNLNLSVSCDLNKDRAILELLQGSRFSGCDSIIIYCTRREQTDRLATYLRTCLQKNPMNTSSCITDQNEGDEAMEKEEKKKRGRKRKNESAKSKSGKKSMAWHAECYHAGLSAAQRKKVQKKFMAGELRIVVATVAFGMGLDKADVRAVIHYNMPKSFESYVQEIGRAGRDGLPSHCHVFIDPEGKDVRELRRHAHASTVDRNTIKKLVHQIFPTCDCKTLHANMKEKRENELSQLDVSGDCGSNDAPNQISDWFDADDGDIVDHVIEFESQSSEGLGANCDDIVEAGTGEINPETNGNSRQNVDDIDGSKSDDKGEIVVLENDVIMSGDVTKNDDATNDNIVADDANAGTSDVLITQTEGNHDDSKRVCGGHEVAIPIAKAVEQLDMKEEAIETQLCYLELHAKRWVQLLKSVRSTCTLKFYGGPAHLHYVAQRVPIVTAAVAYARKRGEFKRNTSSLTFPVVEIVDGMGWDLEPVRRELYGLQWNEGLRLAGETGLSTGHSGTIVEFTDLAFHLRAPGDLSGDERDEVCDFLEDRIMAQERSQLAQLYNVWSTFNTRAHPNCWQSAEECDKDVDSVLKSIIKAYFENENDATKLQLEALSTARKNSEFLQSVIPTDEQVNWDGVSRDIRSFITSHGDLELSGRAIARVFHGIDSPCFPASVWGRERRYWRRHLDVDFNLLRKCATKELVKFR